MQGEVSGPPLRARFGRRTGPRARTGACLRLAAAMVLGAQAAGPSLTVRAQPAPSFLARCGELKRSIEKLGPKDDTLVVIEVAGPLTAVHSDGALVYLSMCKPPDPQVLCVTYSADGRKAGDEAVLTGAYTQRGPDHVLLDPCLPRAPD